MWMEMGGENSPAEGRYFVKDKKCRMGMEEEQKMQWESHKGS